MIRLQGQYNMQRAQSLLTESLQGNKISGGGKMIINQDKIDIRADSRQIMEKEFARRMADEVLTEVNTDPSKERIAELERRIAEGTYQVDAAAVAEKIFRYGGME